MSATDQIALLLVLLWAHFWGSIAVSWVAGQRGYSSVGWFFYSLIFYGPLFALIALAGAPSKKS